MSPFIKPFFIAQTFLTRIPTPKMSRISEKELSLSILYYPVIGLCIGLFLTILSYLFPLFVGDDALSVVAVIIVMAWVLVTGALHLDGLADTADGFLGGQGSTERTLKIMKDPVSGPAGIASIFLVLMLKYSAILAILESDLSLWGILLAPFIARALAIGLLTYTPVSQEAGLAFDLKKIDFPELVATILLVVSVVVYFATNIYVLITLALLVYGIRHWAMSRLKGITGDVLGLSIEVIEALFLVMLVLALV
ncbi:MAG TPA: adenosylcobinamide-GDP ribazoletransferase [Leucothrix mucor]|nr:adenosylcobinamide-GDP ribazoletransferase [Leucothrix mucor]